MGGVRVSVGWTGVKWWGGGPAHSGGTGQLGHEAQRGGGGGCSVFISFVLFFLFILLSLFLIVLVFCEIYTWHLIWYFNLVHYHKNSSPQII